MQLRPFALLCGTLLALADSPAQLRPDQAARIQAAAPSAARIQPARPRTVLIWNTPAPLMEKDPHKGYTIPQSEHAFRVLGEKTGAFTSVVTDDPSAFLPENLKRFDAIVLNNASGPWIRPAPDGLAPFAGKASSVEAAEALLRQSLLDFVTNGGGLFAFHYAIGANAHWPEFQELLGAKFTGHPWNEEVGIRLEEKAHPLLHAFAGKDFTLADEIYEFGPPFSRAGVRVLLSLDPDRTNMNAQWRKRTDDDHAQAWVKTEGKGRIFYSGFGHRTEIWWNPLILQFYLDALQFVCGDLDAPSEPRGPEPPPGFVSLFDGNTLDGWQGDRRLWSVRDGAITGQTTPNARVTENNFLFWKEPVEDFELRLQFRLEGGNSGIYFRAKKRPDGTTGGEPLAGMQADFSADGRWTGVIMEYTLREVLAERGQKVTIDPDGTKRITGSVGEAGKLLSAVNLKEWNHYVVTARGGHVVLRINGKTMCELEDNDPRRIPEGWLALQVHTGPPMTVQFRDIYLRRF